MGKCVRCGREFTVLLKPENDTCFPCREDAKDQATEDREFAWFESQRRNGKSK